MNSTPSNKNQSKYTLTARDELELTGLKLALQEMRALYDIQHKSWDAIDKKGGTLLTSASVVLILAGYASIDTGWPRPAMVLLVRSGCCIWPVRLTDHDNSKERLPTRIPHPHSP